MIPKAAHLDGKFGAIRSNETTFASGDVLDGMKTEATKVTERANLLCLIRAAKGVARVGH